MSKNNARQLPVEIITPIEGKDNEGRYFDLSKHPIDTHQYQLLVPIPTDILLGDRAVDIERLLSTAGAIATDRNGSIILLGVATADRETLTNLADGRRDIDNAMPEVREQVTRLVELAQNDVPDTRMTGCVAVGTDPIAIIQTVVAKHDYDSVLLLREPPTGERRLFARNVVHSVLDGVDCAVFVEGVEATPERSTLYIPTDKPYAERLELASTGRILLAVGSGPHSVLSAEIARALGRAHGVSVDLLHLIERDADPQLRQQGHELLALAEYVLDEVECNTILAETDNVAEEIVKRSKEYDMTIIGAPTKRRLLNRLLYKSVPETVTNETTTAVLMVKEPVEPVDSIYYRWKKAIEAIEENTN